MPEKAEPAPAGEAVLLLMELRVSPPVANGLTVRRKRALGFAVSDNGHFNRRRFPLSTGILIIFQVNLGQVMNGGLGTASSPAGFRIGLFHGDEAVPALFMNWCRARLAQPT